MLRVVLLLLIVVASQSLSAQSPTTPIPEPITGNLVIVGGGGMPEVVRQKFIELAGGEKAKIVVIPTASVDAEDPKQEESFTGPWKKLKPASVVLFHTKDTQKANDPEYVKPLTEATAVWFSGGDQSRITAAYKGTLVEKRLHELLARKGTIGGTSAGAAIMSSPMITGGKDKATLAPGLGFLPGVLVDQHFIKRDRKSRLLGAIKDQPNTVGIGIDESTAVVVTGRKIEVLGDSTATILLAAGAGRETLEVTLTAKQTADLLQLRRAALNRAAKEPFPPAKPAEPKVDKGTLVIVGGGGTTKEIMDTFFEKAGGKDALIVLIPTASEVDPIPETPADLAILKRYGGTNIKMLHTRSRKEADDPKFSEILLKAGGVWFGGGRQWRFVDSYEGTLTEKRFKEVLNRGGVIGGTSAGASIQSEYMPRGHPLGNTVMDAEGYEKGFGFLPGVAVDQHFFARKRLPDMQGLMKRYPQYLGIGIDEATAVVVSKSEARVIGKSKAGFFWQGETVEVKAGEGYDLNTKKMLKP